MNGQEIEHIRKALNLTQTQFAALLGVHFVTVSRWESNVLSPPPYQRGLIQKFGDAARNKKAHQDIAGILVGAGVITALFVLLKWALEDE